MAAPDAANEKFAAAVFGRGNAGTEGGMILLEHGNRIVLETFKEALVK
jgi:hypothetical protein